jgi:hypothetical protein
VPRSRAWFSGDDLGSRAPLIRNVEYISTFSCCVRLHYFLRWASGGGAEPRRGRHAYAAAVPRPTKETRRRGVATESTLGLIQRPHGGASDASLATCPPGRCAQQRPAETPPHPRSHHGPSSVPLRPPQLEEKNDPDASPWRWGGGPAIFVQEARLCRAGSPCVSNGEGPREGAAAPFREASAASDQPLDLAKDFMVSARSWQPSRGMAL